LCRVGGSCFRKTSSSAGKPSAEGRLVTSTKGCTCPLAGLSLSRYHPVHRGKGGGGNYAREKECHVKMLSGNVRCFRSLSCGVSAFASAEDQRRADGANARLGTRDRGFGVRDRHLAHHRTRGFESTPTFMASWESQRTSARILSLLQPACWCITPAANVASLS